MARGDDDVLFFALNILSAPFHLFLVPHFTSPILCHLTFDMPGLIMAVGYALFSRPSFFIFWHLFLFFFSLLFFFFSL